MTSSGRKASLCLLLLVVTLYGPLVFGKTAESFAASSSEWFVKLQPGDNATLSTKGGTLEASFKVDIEKTAQDGNYTYNESSFEILLKEPIPLSPDIDRIIFEAAGNEFKTWSTRNEVVQLWPMVEDANREHLFYFPQKYPHLGSGSASWSRWMTLPFHCGEAGGAAQYIYRAEGGDGNAWPDGQLSFIGFKVIVRKASPGVKTGTVAMGEISFSKGELPPVKPFLYADSIFKRSGSYHFKGQIATAFQAVPVVEFDKEIHFDLESMDSRRQKLEFPLPEGNGDFWLKYGVSDEAGLLIASNEFRSQTANLERICNASPVDVRKAPEMGLMRINPERNGSGVYGAEEKPTIQVRVFPKDGLKLELSWELLQYEFDCKMAEGTIPVDRGTKDYDDLSVIPPLQAGQDAYRLRLTLKRNQDTVESQIYVFGRKTDLSKPFNPLQIVKPSREALKKSAYIHCTYCPYSRTKYASIDAAAADCFNIMDKYMCVTRNWNIKADPSAMEVLPGVYDFSYLDIVMDGAWRRGLYVTTWLVHSEEEHPYLWLPYSHQRNFDGSEIDEHYYGGYSLEDRQTLNAWFALIDAIRRRYGQHPAFQGYYLFQPAGEFTIEDKPWEGLVAGYEKPMEPAFRNYLKEDLNLDLVALNARWKTNYESWDQVVPPRPLFKLGAMPDLRMSWVDFCNFKSKLNAVGWFPEAAEHIRSQDKDALIIIYGGFIKPKALGGLVDYFHNGGNHYLRGEGSLVDAWERNSTGWISEPHHPQRWAAYGDPAGKGWCLDWTIWMSMAQAGGGGANLHFYSDPLDKSSLQIHYGKTFAYDRVSKFQPILNELITSHLVEGAKPQVGIMHDPLTLACKHRTVFNDRREDLKRCFELLKNESIPVVEADKAQAGQLRLVIPNFLDEVMDEANIKRIDHLVRDEGCKLLMTGITGKYCPERGDEPWQLLKQFGIKPPDGAYVQHEAGVEANVVKANPLFADGDKVPFYTLAQLQQDLQSPEIKKDFWKFPYRWIPETDYFGYFKDNMDAGGEVWARFTSGAVAVSCHHVGKGEVVVFWGIPDYRLAKLGGMMTMAAKWAGVTTAVQGNPILLAIETHSDMLDRHYALLYNEKPGAYVQRIPNAPNGNWFVEELVGDRKLGSYSGRGLREKGIELQYLDGASPLQILRLTSLEEVRKSQMPGADDWTFKYPQHE